MFQGLKQWQSHDPGLASLALTGSQTLSGKRTESDQIMSGSLPRKEVSLNINQAQVICYTVTISTKYKTNLYELCN